MTSDQTSPNPARTGRWKTALLVVSLGLNLLVAAAVATHWVTDRYHHHGGDGAGMHSRLLPREFLRELPRARREELRAMFRETARGMHGERQYFMTHVGDLADALERTPYDAAAVSAALAAMTAQGQRLSGVRIEIAGKLAAALSDEERASLARHLRERMERKQRRWRDRDGD